MEHENNMNSAAEDRHAPRNATFAQNAILTIKLLAIGSAILAALWGIDLWNAG